MNTNKYFISAYDFDSTVTEYQIFLLCVHSSDESIVEEWIQVSCGSSSGDAIYSKEPFILEGEYLTLFHNRRSITSKFYETVKHGLIQFSEKISNFSRNLRTLSIDRRSRFFGCPKSNVYLFERDEKYINPYSEHCFLQVEHDCCDSLISKAFTPLNLFWHIKTHPHLEIEYGTDLEYLENELGIQYDLNKHIHNSEYGRHLLPEDGELLLYATYGYYMSIVNSVLDSYYYNSFYDNGRKLNRK